MKARKGGPHEVAPETEIDKGISHNLCPIAEGISVPFLHLLAPETTSTTHYFCAHDDSELSERLRQGAVRAFEYEDEPMIEAQQREIEPGKDLMELGLVLLPPDVPAVKGRRLLATMIEAEAANA